MGGLRPTARLHPWVLMLALVLVMRVFVPQGWMPDGAGDNFFTIKPCPTQWTLPDAQARMSGHHAHEGMADIEDGADHGDHAEHSVIDPCAFAGFAMPALAGGDFAILPAAVLGPQFFDRARSDTIVLAWRRTLPPARAPPIPA